MMDDRVISPPLAQLAKLRQPLTAGERAVLQLFRQHLPKDWEIYLQPHLNGLRPDFVLLNPNGGIAVFEVKDWDLKAMRYFTKKGRYGHELWAERNGEEFCIQNQNPVTKVNLYKKEIFDLYCPRLKANTGWAAITAGVIFPFADVDAVKSLLSPFLKTQDGEKFAQYQPVSGIVEVTAGKILDVFPEANRTNSKIMSKGYADDLRGWLVEPDLSSTQRTPLVLDRNQLSLAESRTESGYRRIKGPAGSGKSLVLAARAARLANEGKSVLVATFNITLWHYLRDLIVRGLDAPEKLKNVRFTHFHLWCKHVCYDAGWDKGYERLWHSNDPREVLNTTLPLLADEAVTLPNIERYDAIFVDEGQDYLPLWWSVLRKACNPGGEMLLVADATQDVYGTASSWTDEAMKGAGFGGRWAQLATSYRLPPEALGLARNFAEAFLPKDAIDLPEAEQGSLDLYPCRLRWVQCSPDTAGAVCSNEILSLMRQTGKRGLANADITMLTGDMQSGMNVVNRLDEYDINVVNTFGDDHRRRKMGFYMGDTRIKATTLHSFKGWESRLLVIYVPDAAHAQSLALVYAGLTRLKRSQEGSWLTVVCSAPELHEFGRSFPDYADGASATVV
ncbi:AAA family ATPase [Rhizobium laguerreae]|nr:AAA family ATPase [Rhizobium laguerreae]